MSDQGSDWVIELANEVLANADKRSRPIKNISQLQLDQLSFSGLMTETQAGRFRTENGKLDLIALRRFKKALNVKPETTDKKVATQE